MTHGEGTAQAAVPVNFDVGKTLPVRIFDEITELRVRRPNVAEQEAKRRKRRTHIAPDGRLVLVAVDHPARGVTQIRKEELAMGDRYQLLARTRRVFDDPQMDGIVATADILEELLYLSYLERKEGGKSFLDGRVLVGTMNRGGLAGTAFEMDDTFTGMTAKRIAELRLDGGKMMFRLDPADAGSGNTVEACAEAINELRKNRLPAFVEALTMEKKPGGGYHTLNNAAMLIRNCGIAAGLGDSSTHVWLKLPYCQDFDKVGMATTLPILLLGGPARESQRETLADFAAGMASSPRVRGAIIGRNLLFPVEGDPLPMCNALTELVHGKRKKK
jgi:DhnA family fructose-bisphosphate aldolase class Ia